MAKIPKYMTDIDAFLELCLDMPETYGTNLEGKLAGRSILNHQQVLSTMFTNSWRYIKDNWDISEGMDVLDFGCGSGVLGLYAVAEGAASVVSSDVNPYACMIAEINAERLEMSDKITVVESDCYDNIEGRFDRIVFNLPYNNRAADPQIPLHRAVFDENYDVTRKSLEQAPLYLKPEGKMILNFASMGDVEAILQVVKESPMKINRYGTQQDQHKRYLLTLSPQ